MKGLEYIIDKFDKLTEKIGKHNLMLIAFIVIVLVITGLYSTFSLFTSSEGVDIVDGLTTYRFILDSTLSDTSVIVPANTDKNLDVVVTNNEDLSLKYGIYYTATGEVTIGYTEITSYLPSGNIEANESYTVSLKVVNDTSSDITVNLGFAYGFVNGGDLTLPDGASWIGVLPGSASAASVYVINKYNDGSEITTVNIGGSTDNPEVYLNATQGIMLDNNGEYRYYGADPNNYVSYNNELWRIISVSNVKSSESDSTGETRVKIVKADILTDDNSLSAYSYDSSDSTVNRGYGVNDWSQADLMTELNTLYYNSTSGTCYTGSSNATTACDFTNTGLTEEAKNLTADALYYLGGSSTYSGIYADDYYNFERGTTVYSCSADSCGGARATTWVGRVGIIYPSDYVYATDLSVCTKGGYNYDTDTNCTSNDWLLYSSNWQWTISPRASHAYYAFIVYSTGCVDNGYVYRAGAIRPVQYLRSNVTIVSGEGTSDDPYILGT